MNASVTHLPNVYWVAPENDYDDDDDGDEDDDDDDFNKNVQLHSCLPLPIWDGYVVETCEEVQFVMDDLMVKWYERYWSGS